MFHFAGVIVRRVGRVGSVVLKPPLEGKEPVRSAALYGSLPIVINV